MRNADALLLCNDLGANSKMFRVQFDAKSRNNSSWLNRILLGKNKKVKGEWVITAQRTSPNRDLVDVALININGDKAKDKRPKGEDDFYNQFFEIIKIFSIRFFRIRLPLCQSSNRLGDPSTNQQNEIFGEEFLETICHFDSRS